MNFFEIDLKILKASDRALEICEENFRQIERVTEFNQNKMLKAFIENQVSESHFAPSTGYGYGDRGREVLDRVAADVFEAEDALVRHNFVSGTHALSVALFGVLRPGDKILCVTGLPYDTLHGVLGINRKSTGSLKEFGVGFEYIPLCPDGSIDLITMQQKLARNTYKMLYIQRSRGYTLRPSAFVSEIGLAALAAKAIDEKIIVMVDNCYGEFVETDEPTQHGADLIAGSLIKNPGGGIASTGGYIAGKAEFVEQCAYRLTIPGAGREIGCTHSLNRELFMGFFNAPHVTGEALKTAVFASGLFSELGYETSPKAEEPRTDIITSVILNNEQAVTAFCHGIQSGAPVDSFVRPEPWDMPGYDNQVIMAAGAFTMGASIELSADAPLRPPYAVWLQGGLNFHSAKMGILLGAQAMMGKGLL